MPNPGSYEFFNNLVISWSYDAGHQQLTVSGALNDKPICSGPLVLSPGNNTGQLTCQDGQQTATIDVGANFQTNTIGMQASETNPTKSGAHTGNF